MYSELGEWSAVRATTISAASGVYNTYKVSVKLLYTTEVFWAFSTKVDANLVNFILFSPTLRKLYHIKYDHQLVSIYVSLEKHERSCYLWPTSTKFGVVMQNILKYLTVYSFALKSKMADGRFTWETNSASSWEDGGRPPSWIIEIKNLTDVQF